MAHPTLRRAMTPIASALALVLAFGGISAIAAPAAAAAASPAFDCTEPRFFAQTESSGGVLTLSTGSYTSQGTSVWTPFPTTQSGDNLYNALAFNPADEYLYGTRYAKGTSVLGSFVRIKDDGTLTPLGLSAPALGAYDSALWDSGEFDAVGNYYVASGNGGTSSIHKIAGLKDVRDENSTPRPTRTTITLTPAPAPVFADLTFKSGFLWAANYNKSPSIYRIDINGVLATAGTVTTFDVPALPKASYGSAFTMTNGNLAFIATDGKMRQISVTNPASESPTFQLVSTVQAPTNSKSDATNCATAQTSSLSVTKTGPVKIGVGQTITWEVTVTNEGPGITSGFVLTDTLPAGLTNTTVTSTDTSCVLNTAKTVATCNGGRLAVGATATVTVSATAPMTPGPLANQAYAVGNEDPSPDAPTIARTQVELATQSDVPVTLPASGVLGFVSPTTTAEGGTATYSGGAFTYTPPVGFSGNDTFVYSTASGDVTVYVVVNPIAAAGLNTSTYVDVPVTIDPGTLLDNSVGTGLELSSVGDAVNGSVSIVDGSPVFVPTPGFSGNASFTFTLTDDDGLTATETYTVRVLPTAGPVTTTVAANSSVVITTATLLAATAGTGGTITAVGAPTGGTRSTVTGGYRYTPNAGTSGTDSFSYTVTDGAGRTATNTVTITITPIATNDNKSTPAGTPVTVTVLANDAGTGLEITDVSTPSSGSAAISGGAIVYTPEDDFSGNAAFTYEITDDAGRTATATVTVTVTPSAVDDSLTTPLNTAATINVLTNDIGTGLTVTSHAAALHGTVTIATNGDLAYTPPANYSGLDTLTYALSGAGGTDSATVSILVTPLAPDDVAVTDAGKAIDIDVLANDGGTGLVITGTGTQSARGTVTFTAAGVRYAPAAGFSGIETFTYTARDAAGTSVTATVTVSVRPLAAPSVAKGAAGRSFSFDVSGSGTGTGLVVTSVTPPKNGTAVINPDGTITFTPRAGFSGVEVITYTFTDASGLTATGTVSVTVAPAAVSSVSALPFMGTEPGMLVALAGALLALGGLGLGLRMLRRRAE
ncbi:beta strand repeat-containing protein [Salinibacterium hongtaonis]|uniref:Uncharacterized protein n=1 Tax=Homoserinimonas hongtaonis TaxID=2079791 RepID=A0A2U1T025_9MICO|nr:Ig-like domain-containing protein [Salinibacterium hongtaonis]PWB97206.1 hypothetical protein DF220_04685 [Salinibacterium hongtaonis]